MTIPMLTTHRGYRLQASAAIRDDGLHAADLIQPCGRTLYRRSPRAGASA